VSNSRRARKETNDLSFILPPLIFSLNLKNLCFLKFLRFEYHLLAEYCMFY
jgi:hypothetical protein